jgi:hypothetical protein
MAWAALTAMATAMVEGIEAEMRQTPVSLQNVDFPIFGKEN